MPRPPELEVARRAVADGVFPEAVLEECLAEKRRARADGLDLPLAELLEARGLVTRASWEALEKRAAFAATKSDELPGLGSDLASASSSAGSFPAIADESFGDGVTGATKAIAKGKSLAGTISSTRVESAEVLGEYRLVREIGRGAMGVVYEAIQARLGRRVALKVLPAGAAFSGVARERFLREARAAASLAHPNIVPIYDQGEERGVPFFAMELIQGRTLKAVLLAGRLAPARAARLASQAARALEYAHERGVIHRDVKPDNLFLLESSDPSKERILLADFGLAMRIEDASLTREGTVVGTPLYMAPEQARGDRDKVDRRSDVYGLGATLYEVVSGVPPFEGSRDTQVLLERIKEEEAAPLRSRSREIPAALEAVVGHALEKDPARRYPTAAALADDLDRFLAGEPVHARPPGTLERLARLARKRARAIAAASALVVFSAVGVSVGIPVQRRWRADALVLKAANLERGGRRDEARALLQEALLLVPRLADARARLAAFDAADGNVDAARAALDRAVEDDAESVEARLLRARVELSSARPDFERALADVEVAERSAPRDPRGAYVRGAILAAKGRPGEAGAELERGLELARDVRGRAPDDRAYREALELAGQSRLRARDWERAQADLEESIRLEPDAPRPRVLLGRALVGLGKDALAIDSFSDALRRRPDDPEALELRAASLRRVGRPTDALADLETVAATRPRARLLRGLICAETPESSGDEVDFGYARAREDLQWVLGLDGTAEELAPRGALEPGEVARALAGLAWIELSQGEATAGRVSRAVHWLDVAIRTDPGDPALRLARGLVLVRTKTPEKARPDLEAARARSDLAYAALVGLAKLSVAAQDFPRARALADEAVTLAPARPAARSLRARLLSLSGETDLALADRKAASGDAGAEARAPGQPAPPRRPLLDVADPLEAAECATARGLDAFGLAIRASGAPPPGPPDPYMTPARLGNVRFQSGATQACAWLRRALVLDPDRLAAGQKLADILYVLGRPREAWNAYGRVLELEPTLVEAEIVRGIMERDLLDERAPRRGVATLERAIARLEKAPAAADPTLGARAVYELARAWEAAGELEKALATAEEACRLTPERHAPNALRARLLVRLKRPGAQAAVDLAAKLLHRPPDPAERERQLLFFRAAELGEGLDGKIGIHFYTRAIEAAPSVAAAWRRRGERYFKTSPLEFPRAFVDLATGMELDPESSDTIVDVEGKVHRFLPYAAELELPLTEICESLPDLPGAHFLRGFWDLHKSDDAASAERHLSEALRLAPDWDMPLAYRGLARERLGDLAGAAADLERAAKVAPRNSITVFFGALVLLAKHDVEGCYRELERAAELGFRYADRMRAAPELASLQGDPRFERLLERVGNLDDRKALRRGQPPPLKR